MNSRLQRARVVAAITVLSTALLACTADEDEVAPTASSPEVASIAAPENNPETQELEGGLVLSDPGAFAGYTLFSPYLATTTFLVDMQAEVVHRWENEHIPAGSPYLLDDGTLLRAADTQNPRFRSNGTGGRLQLIDWEGKVVWDYLVSDDRRMQNHDIEPLPNGNVLVCAWEYRSREEAIAAGADPARVSAKGSWPAVLIEIEPVPPDGGKIVWEWNAWDHLVQDLDSARDNYSEVAAHPELLNINAGRKRPRLSDEERERLRERDEQMRAIGYTGDDDEEQDEGQPESSGSDWGNSMSVDWMHVNAVAYEPDLDLVVISSYELSEVLVIDHSTTSAEAAAHTGGRYGKGGDILYRWGNPQNYRAGSAADRQLFNQHDSRWLPGPRLMVFNNGFGRPGGSYSTIDEIVLPFDSRLGFSREEGTAFGPAAPEWIYRADPPEDFNGSFISGAHRLPNGNTFICSGPNGRLFEVTGSGRIVWEYDIPYAGISVSDWWGRFGWGDDFGDMGGTGSGEGGEDYGDMDMEDYGSALMKPQAAFRATRLAPDHPGLRRLAE